MILRAGAISVQGLVEQIGTSATNIRRDLARLERRGLLIRTRGGAILPALLLYKPFHHDPAAQVDQLLFIEQKRRIGLAASELIGESETIGLAAGTTTAQIGRALRHRYRISVITNALNIAMELSHQSAIKTTLTSGVLAEGPTFALVAESAVSFLKDVYLDKAFIGVAGLDIERGATMLDSDEALVARTMIQQSSQVIVVADSSKINRVSRICLCPCSAVDVLVTDTGISEASCEAFRAKGIKVICA
jgi:DeoR family transcriptional regulator of aga operon